MLPQTCGVFFSSSNVINFLSNAIVGVFSDERSDNIVCTRVPFRFTFLRQAKNEQEMNQWTVLLIFNKIRSMKVT